MKLGSTLIDVVCDGTFLLDGGALFGQVPKALWELQMRPDWKPWALARTMNWHKKADILV